MKDMETEKIAFLPPELQAIKPRPVKVFSTEAIEVKVCGNVMKIEGLRIESGQSAIDIEVP